MSEDSKKNWKGKTNQASEFAKNIWLAGLGAYGRAFDEAQGAYEQASKKTPRLFTELVEKGKNLETEARDKIGEVDLKSKATSLEQRLQKMRHALGFGSDETDAHIASLEKKIDKLTRQVDHLVKAMEQVGAGKTAPARRTPAKTAAKAAPAKKTVAKTTTGGTTTS